MAAQGNGVRWESTVDAARERARKEKRPVLIDFSAAPM
jgi:hypothetical protein